jgi:hypothetical protein
MEHLLAKDGKDSEYLNVFLAADFLMEVRNRQLYDQVDRVILACLGKLSQPPPLSIKDWNISRNVCESIGRIWQDERVGCEKLQELSLMGHDFAIFGLVEHYSNEQDTHSIVRELTRQGNISAIHLLGQYYRDEPETYLIFTELATQGNDLAIHVMAEHFAAKPDTHSLIQELASQGSNTATSVLVHYYGE